MPRTLDPTLHQVRRDAFLDVAQRLIQVKGYEAMTVQEILAELEASKGAFYHYFDSKQALLEAVVARMVDAAILNVAPVVADPRLDAPTKLQRVFSASSTWKAERKELMVALIEVWESDGNALVREKVRRQSGGQLVPVLSAVVRQGIDEGHFAAGSPEQTAAVLVTLLQGFGVRYTELFIARQAGSVTFDEVKRCSNAFDDAVVRILGLPPGSLTLADDRALHFWFD